MNIEEKLELVYHKIKRKRGGKNAAYIPALSIVDPALYAISICTVDGKQYDIGDYKTFFSIQSVSKVFSLILALEKYGAEYLKKNIGNKPSKLPYDSIKEIENNPSHLSNSFSNAGAIATTCLSFETGCASSKFEKKMIDNMNKFAGKKLHVNKEIYDSEFSLADHNFALAYLLKSYSRMSGNVNTCVDIYTRQCSVMVTSQDVAVMAATIANGGKNPITKEVAMNKKHVPYVIDQMYKNGMYNQSEEFNEKAGIPCKSGVGGSLLIVIPGIMGISIFSPPLNKYGNSFKGLHTAIMLAAELKLKPKFVNFNY